MNTKKILSILALILSGLLALSFLLKFNNKRDVVSLILWVTILLVGVSQLLGYSENYSSETDTSALPCPPNYVSGKFANAIGNGLELDYGESSNSGFFINNNDDFKGNQNPYHRLPRNILVPGISGENPDMTVDDPNCSGTQCNWMKGTPESRSSNLYQEVVNAIVNSDPLQHAVLAPTESLPCGIAPGGWQVNQCPRNRLNPTPELKNVFSSKKV
jgi:hypothetical protein